MSMDFIDQVKQFSKRVESIKGTILTEEATKTSIIMPFFSLLGYDVFNPQEFVPEYTADVGIKKGEKVDYAIMQDGNPIILIEAKWIGEPLEKHDSQLFRYFGTTKAKLAILTNGANFRFFTDLEDKNKMDEKPFFEFNILDIKENQVSELKKFHKSIFNLSDVLSTAEELKYVNEFKLNMAAELQNPSDDFVRLFLTSVYSGQKTQSVIERFRPILKKSLNNYISELMSDKLKSALESEHVTEPEIEQQNEEAIPEKTEPKIITTPEELEAYFIVKNALKDHVPASEITIKDTESYLNILYKGNVRKWICRIILTPTTRLLIIPDENKKEIKYPLEDIYDIEKYKEQLIEVLCRFLNPKCN